MTAAELEGPYRAALAAIGRTPYATAPESVRAAWIVGWICATGPQEHADLRDSAALAAYKEGFAACMTANGGPPCTVCGEPVLDPEAELYSGGEYTHIACEPEEERFLDAEDIAYERARAAGWED